MPRWGKKPKHQPPPPPPEGGPIAYGYGRVSTEKQAGPDKGSPQAQRSAISAYFDFCLKGTFRDGGFVLDTVSGNTRFCERPEGGKLALKLRPGDAVVFSKLDRGFRSMRDLVLTAVDWMDRGIQLHFLDLKIDTGTPMGKFLMHILAAVAEFERARLAERVAEGFAQARAKGKPLGGPPYGFRIAGKRPNRYLVSNPEQRAIGQEIVRLHEQETMTFKQIAPVIEARGYRGSNGTAGEVMSERTVARYYNWEKDLQRKERWANIKKELLPEGE